MSITHGTRALYKFASCNTDSVHKWLTWSTKTAVIWVYTVRIWTNTTCRKIIRKFIPKKGMLQNSSGSSEDALCGMFRVGTLVLYHYSIWRWKSPWYTVFSLCLCAYTSHFVLLIYRIEEPHGIWRCCCWQCLLICNLWGWRIVLKIYPQVFKGTSMCFPGDGFKGSPILWELHRHRGHPLAKPSLTMYMGEVDCYEGHTRNRLI